MNLLLLLKHKSLVVIQELLVMAEKTVTVLNTANKCLTLVKVELNSWVLKG